MNRWVVLILFVTLGAKLISSGLMVSMPHGMDMDACEGARCGVTTDQCLEHCLAASQAGALLPHAAPAVFFLVVALVAAFAAVVTVARVRGFTTGLAPPGLIFVRNTILRE